ncbi:hypothetical protein BH09PAT3_BH09PAT3_4290 [soil metagenome]
MQYYTRAMHYVAENWRSLLRSVILQVVFGLGCMLVVQLPLGAALSDSMPRLTAYAIAFVASGHVNFLLHGIVTYGKREPGWHHLRRPNWQELRSSYPKFVIATASLSLINAQIRLALAFMESSLVAALLATMTTGIMALIANRLVVYARKTPPTNAR